MELKLLSLVIPVYNEEPNMAEVCSGLRTTLDSLCFPYEIIVVDDGSKDRTFSILRGIQANDSRIKVVRLAKNCGQAYAFWAGFDISKGDVIITMDGDLQNDPADIPLFLKEIEKGFEAVNGWRHARNDSCVRKSISCLANWFIGLKTGVKLHDYGCAFMAIRRSLMDRLLSRGRGCRFIKPLIACLAQSIGEIRIRHHPRKHGNSKYSLLKIFKTGLHFALSFKARLFKRQASRFIIENPRYLGSKT